MKTTKVQLRQIVIETLKGKAPGQDDVPTQFNELARAVTGVLAKQNAPAGEGRMSYGLYPELSPEDKTMLLEVFWDLFREGVITLGMDSANMEFPWFRVHSEAKL